MSHPSSYGLKYSTVSVSMLLCIRILQNILNNDLACGNGVKLPFKNTSWLLKPKSCSFTMFFLMLHLISHGGKFDLFFNSSFTRLNKRSGIFVSFLCILKGLNSFHECMSVSTNKQKRLRSRQEKVIY